MNAESPQSLHVCIRVDDCVITSKPVLEVRYRGEPYPTMISIAITLIHHRRGTPGISFATNKFDEYCEDDFDLSLELAGELLEYEQDNTGAAKGKRESEALGGWCFEEQREGVVK